MSRKFNADNANYLDCGDPSYGQIMGTNITAQIWVKLFDTAGSPKLFCKWGIALNTHEWLIAIDSGTGKFSIWTNVSGSSNYTNAQSQQTIMQRRWYHVVLQQSSAGITCFVDGIPSTIGTPGQSIQDTANRLLIGKGEDGSAVNAYLAHAAIWAGVLQSREIFALSQGRSPRDVCPGWLRGYWPLDAYKDEPDWSGRHNKAAMNGSVSAVPTDDPYGAAMTQIPFGVFAVVTEGPTEMLAPFIASATSLFAPYILPGAPISVPFISSTTALFTPTISEHLEPAPFIAAVTTLYTPSVRRASIPVPFLEPATQVFTARIARPLVNISPPAISGTAMEGQQLEASSGVWSGTEPITYAYQWRRCDAGGGSCVDIAGATTATYIVQAADIGSTLRIRVTATQTA
jgi:hypothetical protein